MPVATKKAAPKKAAAKRTVTSVQKEFDDFKKRVADEVVNFNNQYGETCEDRTDFLRKLDLPVPSRTGIFVVTVRAEVEDDSDSSLGYNSHSKTCDTVALEIERALASIKSQFNVEIVDFDSWDD